MRFAHPIILMVVLVVLGEGVAADTPARADPPRVVVSVNPVHSLVAMVMKGVGTPTLLVKGAGSPHTYSMRPSEARALANAQVVFYVGESLETFLEKPLNSLAGKATVVVLEKQPGMIRLRTREGGLWEGHDEEDDDRGHTSGAKKRDDKGHDDHHKQGADKADDHDDHDHAAYDGHIWLDPHNAERIVEVAVVTLGKADPANAATYRANGKVAVRSIRALDAQIGREIAPVRRRPFIVFHDAYRYFEARYRLNAAGSITVSPDRPPGAKRLFEIRGRILKQRVRCVFAEPQFRPSLVRTVVEGTPAKTAVLDPLGADIPAGTQAYMTLMRRLAKSLVGCLSRTS